jgi:hypothetical protein
MMLNKSVNVFGYFDGPAGKVQSQTAAVGATKRLGELGAKGPDAPASKTGHFA